MVDFQLSLLTALSLIRLNKNDNALKTRLLKIVASSDSGGVEHKDSLSRTAKLVLAASSSTPNRNKTVTVTNDGKPERPSLYSSHVEQKNAPKVLFYFYVGCLTDYPENSLP